MQLLTFKPILRPMLVTILFCLSLLLVGNSSPSSSVAQEVTESAAENVRAGEIAKKKSVSFYLANGDLDQAEKMLREQLNSLDSNDGSRLARNHANQYLAHLAEANGDFARALTHWTAIVPTEGHENRDGVSAFIAACRQQLDENEATQAGLAAVHKEFLVGQASRSRDRVFSAYQKYSEILGQDHIYPNVALLQLARVASNLTPQQNELIEQAKISLGKKHGISALYWADREFVRGSRFLTKTKNESFNKALSILKPAESIYEAGRSIDESRWIMLRLDQSFFLTAMFSFQPARQLLTEVQASLESNELTPVHHFAFHNRNGHFLFYATLPREAFRALRSSIEVVKSHPKLKKSDTKQVAESLIELAMLWRHRFEVAIEYADQAISLNRENTLDPQVLERDDAILRWYRGKIYFDGSKFSEAEKEQDFAIAEFRKSNPGYLPAALRDLAKTYSVNGDFDESLRLFNEALPFFMSESGLVNRSDFLTDRTMALQGLGRLEEAMRSLELANQLAIDDCRINLPAMSVHSAVGLSAQTNYPRSMAVRIATGSRDPVLLRQALGIVMYSKRVATTYLQQRNGAQLDSQDPAIVKAKADYLQSCESFIQASIQDKTPDELEKIELEKRQRWIIFANLMQKPGHRFAVENNDQLLAKLESALPEDTCLLEFAVSESPVRKFGRQYCVFVIRKPAGQTKLSIELVELGDEGEINQLIRGRQVHIDNAINFRPGDLAKDSVPNKDKADNPKSNNGKNESKFKKMLTLRGLKSDAKVTKSNLKLNLELDRLIWGKLEPYLGDAKKLVICPTGRLDTLAWSSLRDPSSGEFVVKQQKLQLIVNESAQHFADELTMNKSQSEVQNLLAVGGVDYGKSDIEFFPALKETKQEATMVASYFTAVGRQFRLISGREYTKTNFQNLIGSHSHIHIAGHGLLLSKLPSQTVSTRTGEFKKKQSGSNPLADSSLALTDANVLQDGSYSAEHFLTGEDIMQLDLRHVDLVVLSTCYSGLGTSSNREGVFGIEKAFRLAGARSTLSCQTSLDDLSARLFVKSFYKHLLQDKLSKSGAFHAAQLRMIELKVPPENWISWQLIGDGR